MLILKLLMVVVTEIRCNTKKISMAIPSASEAWDREGLIYHPHDELHTEIDADIKHLLSVAIKGHIGEPVAILNIDNIIDDEINEELKNHISTSSLQLTELI